MYKVKVINGVLIREGTDVQSDVETSFYQSLCRIMGGVLHMLCISYTWVFDLSAKDLLKSGKFPGKKSF